VKWFEKSRLLQQAVSAGPMKRFSGTDGTTILLALWTVIQKKRRTGDKKTTEGKKRTWKSGL